MLRHALLLALALLSPGAAARQPAAETGTARPNILLIVADDQRWDTLGVAGNALAHTPNLDRLAADGMYFSEATCLTPQCAPERAVLLTGLTPTQSGYFSIDVQAEGVDSADAFEQVQTLPSMLRDAGYRTALIGKWHLKARPLLCGFTEAPLWFDGGQTPYENPPLRRGDNDPQPTPGNITELFAEQAAAFLASPEAASAPFFLSLCFTAPHEPCGPIPPRIADLYAGLTDEDLMPADMPRPATGRFRGKWADYYRAVAHLDEQAGRVLDALDAADLRESTLVVYTSDSGIMMGRRGIDSKVCPFEDSARIPTIVRAPMLGGPRGRIDAPVSNLDLPVTLAASSGLTPPQRWMGRDLSRLWRTGSDPSVDSAVIAWAEGTREPWKKFSNRTLRSADWKLIVWEDPGRADSIYHISIDPAETVDAAGTPEGLRISSAMKPKLKAWLDRAGDPAAHWPDKWPR